ncbi:hypothetical protein PROFUN_11522 [Planoprotostelium fungivorum]|uniref:BAR domain-containing protein n=1 Tax=Planoprotostelium fungivorum TaxID=1890364 RepID=A0A2P6NA13_9EUKA|nr:hypothetical protein PROFUN_11522 [Planoprotostelium fungivorum]
MKNQNSDENSSSQSSLPRTRSNRKFGETTRALVWSSPKVLSKSEMDQILTSQPFVLRCCTPISVMIDTISIKGGLVLSTDAVLVRLRCMRSAFAPETVLLENGRSDIYPYTTRRNPTFGDEKVFSNEDSNRQLTSNMKKLGGFVKDVGNSVQKIGAKPTTNDEIFEELKNRFETYRKACENLKRESDKFSTAFKDMGKYYKSVGVELAAVYEFEGTADGQRFKSASDEVEVATRDLTAGVGHITSGLEVLINQNEGLRKRINLRHDLLLDMDIAYKTKDKDHKTEAKYNESRTKYEEVNVKLIDDLRSHLNNSHPEFQGHYREFVNLQRRGFQAIASSVGGL